VSRPVTFLDVFADRPLAGNGLAVVNDADGLADEVMFAYARETRLSETTFVQSATAKGADYRNRIWTPGEELPFAGHPSLGTAVAVARWGGEERASYVQQTGAGLQPVDVRRERPGDGGELWRASMLQEPADFGEELDPSAVMAAAGLEPSDAHPELPPQIVSTGVAHAIAPLAEAAALDSVAPDYPAIDALISPRGAITLYLCCWSPDGSGRARAFSRIVEMGEDPATGSAAGPLCAYLAQRGALDRLKLAQGAEMGRPSTIEAEMEGERVRVSGAVVPLLDGEIELPESV
jgi:trans-2,3-dihydro-3-hydroxyanthranilate isomerase